MFKTITKVSNKLKLSTKVLLLVAVVVAIIGARPLLFGQAGKTGQTQVWLDGGVVGKSTVQINALDSAVLDKNTGCAKVKFNIIGTAAKGQMIEAFRALVYKNDNSGKSILTHAVFSIGQAGWVPYQCGTYASLCTWSVPISFCSANTYNIKATVYTARMFDVYDPYGKKLQSNWSSAIESQLYDKKIVISNTGTPTIDSALSSDKETGAISFALPTASPSSKKSFQVVVNASSSVGVKQINIDVGGKTDYFNCNLGKSCSHNFVVNGLSAGSYPVIAWADSTGDHVYSSAEKMLVISNIK